MNQFEKKLVKDSKRKFVKHKWISVRVKKTASVPYEKSFFHKIIADSKEPLLHRDFLIYLHDNYLTIKSDAFLFEPIKVLLHDKLWIELLYVFKLSGETDNKDIKESSRNADNLSV